MVLVIIQNEMTLRIILNRGKVLLQYAVLTLNHHFGFDRHNKLIDLYGIFLHVLSTKITIFHIVENCHYNAYELLSKDYGVIV